MIERGTGLSEESTEDAHFYQQDDAGVEHHNQRVYGTLRNYRAQGFAERYAVYTLQNCTT